MYKYPTTSSLGSQKSQRTICNKEAELFCHSDRGDRSGRGSHRGRGGRGRKGDDDIDDGTTLSFLTEMMATTMSL
ncbi:hypothetical protein RclHR1_05340001 [Rhizophagus clarus]|uniref:Uncharacterized protein n=1 Tax=Rhizophagus clarus TaxID=94130 RepID=A0A2Z6R4P3_9GLOM|nr:hypothetical protein RclHR1_29650001 [Rhizophagus clarus]GBC03815.1 hypothetical protein RclHR1_05340001 [Rhizophagus clarus]